VKTDVLDKESVKPLYLQIREELLEKARTNPGFRFPSERKLCSVYKVSRPTIQKALSYFIENDMISRRPGKGTFLKSGADVDLQTVETVKVVIRHDWKMWKGDSYTGRIIEGLIGGLSLHDCQVGIQIYSDKLEHQLLESPETVSVWISPEEDEIQAMKNLTDSGRRTIAINRHVDYPGIGFICNDHAAGSEMAVEYLFNRGLRKILYVGSRQNNSMDKDRYNGFLNGYAKHNMVPELGPFQLDPVDYVGDFNRLLPKLLDSENRPDAIFLADGNYQLPVMKIINELNLKIPHDLSIISYDNLQDVSELYGLTVVQQPLREMSRKAFEMVYEKEVSVASKVILKPQIIERNSVKGLTK